MRIKLLWFVFILSGIGACNESSKPEYFSQEEIRIYNFQDERITDSLQAYVSNEDANHLTLASLTFGSVQDSSANKVLLQLLKNTDPEVRSAAAFSLGQTGGSKLDEVLKNHISNEQSVKVRAILLEAFGKVCSKESALWLLELPHTNNDDTRGIAWSLYRIALRGQASDSLLPLAFQLYSPEAEQNARLGLAHFFARSTGLDFKSYQQELNQIILDEKDPEVLMALLSTLRKIPETTSLEILTEQFNKADDYRLKVSVCRALASFDWGISESIILKALLDEHPQVSIAAAESIHLDNSSSTMELNNVSKKIKNDFAKALVYKNLLKHSPNPEIIREIQNIFSTNLNPYTQSFYADLLVYTTEGVDKLRGLVLSNSTPVLRTSAIQALTKLDVINELGYSRTLQLDFYKQALAGGDLAVIGSISSVLTNPKLAYKEIVEEIEFLYQAKSLLQLPRDNEALQTLEKCIAYFEDKPTPAIINEYNHPIAWDIIKQLNATSKARVKTSKGDIVMALLAKEAPGSVANFVKLSQDGYYKDKNFHRVVPNFVIQGGCYRGDGWGSEDYSIRSEFSQRKYKTGSVGMASAGKDTEGTQWFITHSPTPHLDGKYTIFAEVIEGMDVVHQIEIGDKIIDIEIF